MVHPPVAINSVANADYIVLLGGGLGLPESPRKRLEFGFMGDRILQAARFYKAGKAPKIIAVGGNSKPSRSILSEAEYIAQLLREMGVPGKDIILEKRSRTTLENAELTATLLDNHDANDIILVTSALHMPRAYVMFQDMGFAAVTPAAADIYIPDHKEGLWQRLIPSSTGLALSTNALDEMIGAVVYYLRK